MRKKIKIFTIIFFLLTFSFFSYIILSTPFLAIKSILDTLLASSEILESINTQKMFGKFVFASYENSLNVSTGNEAKIEVNLKLFNLITLKKFTISNDEVEVY